MSDPTPRELLADIDARRELADRAESVAIKFRRDPVTFESRILEIELRIVISDALDAHATSLRAQADVDEARVVVRP